jgi:hypothetical protein
MTGLLACATVRGEMLGRSLRIARVAGIPVGVSPWWLVIVVLFTWVLGGSYFPEVIHGISPGASYALGLASVLLLFARDELRYALAGAGYG